MTSDTDKDEWKGMVLGDVYTRIPGCCVCGRDLLETPLDEDGYVMEGFSDTEELATAEFVFGVDQVLGNRLYVFCCDCDSAENKCLQVFKTCPDSYEDRGTIIENVDLLKSLIEVLNEDIGS